MAIKIDAGSVYPNRYTYPQGTYIPSYEPPQFSMPYQIPYPGQYGTQAAGQLGAGFGTTPGQPQADFTQSIAQLTGANAVQSPQIFSGIQPPQITPPITQFTGANNAINVEQSLYQPQPPNIAQLTGANNVGFIPGAMKTIVPSTAAYTGANPITEIGSLEQFRRYEPDLAKIYQLRQEYLNNPRHTNQPIVEHWTGPQVLSAPQLTGANNVVPPSGYYPVSPVSVAALTGSNLGMLWGQPEQPPNPFENTTGPSYGGGGGGGGGGGKPGKYKFPSNAVTRSLRWRVATG